MTASLLTLVLAHAVSVDVEDNTCTTGDELRQRVQAKAPQADITSEPGVEQVRFRFEVGARPSLLTIFAPPGTEPSERRIFGSSCAELIDAAVLMILTATSDRVGAPAAQWDDPDLPGKPRRSRLSAAPMWEVGTAVSVQSLARAVGGASLFIGLSRTTVWLPSARLGVSQSLPTALVLADGSAVFGWTLVELDVALVGFVPFPRAVPERKSRSGGAGACGSAPG